MRGNQVTGLGTGRCNEWQTPRCVFDALGCLFDLDVAAPLDGPLHVTTRCYLSRHGLEYDWFGFVWMNPPFGGRNGILPWLDKFLTHGDGIALTPDRISAPWFQKNWSRADAILFTPKTPFLLPDGRKAGNPAFGNALWGCGQKAVEALVRARNSGFGVLCFPEKLEAASKMAGGGKGPRQADRLDTLTNTHSNQLNAYSRILSSGEGHLHG